MQAIRPSRQFIFLNKKQLTAQPFCFARLNPALPGLQAISFQAPIIKPINVQFGYANGDGNGYVPNVIFEVISRSPKTELHLHQTGSTNLLLLKYAILLKLYNGHQIDPKLAETLDIQAGSSFQEIYQALQDKKLRKVFRVQPPKERKDVVGAHSIIEFTPGQQLPPDVEAIINNGLQAYRDISGLINPLAKNVPIAYLGAYMMAKDLANENVRYMEYRISAGGDFAKQPSLNNTADQLNAFSRDKYPKKDRVVKTPPLLARKFNRLSGAYQNLVNHINLFKSGQSPDDLNKLRLPELVAWVNSGLSDARRDLVSNHKAFDYGIIILFERNESPEEASRVADQVIALRNAGYPIVGVDLAGGELVSPVTNFAEAFDKIKTYNATAAKDKQIGITIHAGETTRSCSTINDSPHTCTPTANQTHLTGYESIEQAIRIASDTTGRTKIRIGHGLQLINATDEINRGFADFLHDQNSLTDQRKAKIIASSPLLQEIIQRKIVLEMCPKSNVHTFGTGYYTGHPAVFFQRLGVPVTLSSDNRLISNSDIDNEYWKLIKNCGLKYVEMKKMMLNGFRGAFIADPNAREALVKDMEARFKSLESDPRFQIGIYLMENGIEVGSDAAKSRPFPSFIDILTQAEKYKFPYLDPNLLQANLNLIFVEMRNDAGQHPMTRPNINGDGPKKIDIAA